MLKASVIRVVCVRGTAKEDGEKMGCCSGDSTFFVFEVSADLFGPICAAS